MPFNLPMKTEFKSTTTGLLVAFAKAFYDVKLAYKNKALIKAAQITADATQMKTVVANSSSELPELKATLNNILTKLQGITTPAGKQNFQIFNTQAMPLFKSVEEQILKQDSQQSDFENTCKDLFDKIREVLHRVETAPDVDATASDQATQGVLNTAQQKVQAKKTELATLERNNKNLQQDLTGVIVPAFRALPPDAQTVPLSERITREAMPSRARGS